MIALMRSLFLAAALLAAFPLAAAAAQPAAEIAEPVDTPYPGGVIAIDVDATDTLRGLYRVTQTIPLAPGANQITLLLPEWLPGNHAPRGPIAQLADLRFAVDGRPVAWTRDPIDVYAFHVTLPAGSRVLTARFVHTSPLQSSEGRMTMTPDMVNLQWEKMSLYPAGHHVRRIRVKPSVTVPHGWTVRAALDAQAGNPGRTDRITWAETDYETLVDSPVFAGANFRQWDLGGNVTLNVVADDPRQLALTPGNLTRLSTLAGEAQAVFGPPPYDRYEFLVALSDRLGDIGLEHLRSSENKLEPKNFIDWIAYDWDRNVLPHELAHAWNGKYRRPARLWTPDYRRPMEDSLLWVYEGQTQFWGWVLAARSGVQSKETVLGMIAGQAGLYSDQPGRSWRSVEDTTLDPIIAARRPKPYASLARGEDYYNEGALIWLEVDQVIRAGTAGRKGLDDFARAFFAHPGDGSRQSLYEFDDVVTALNAVYPYDWAAFLRRRIEQPGQPAPLAGIERAGYRLVWKDEPNPYDKSRMDYHRNLDLGFSIGLVLESDGDVAATRWGSAAFDAGIVGGARVIAVDSIAYTQDAMRQAIARAQGGSQPIELLIKRGDRYLTVPVRYNAGLRWPWLERVGSGPAPLDRLLAPRRGQAAK